MLWLDVEVLPSNMDEIARNYQRITETICRVTEATGRDPREVRLLAASKQQGLEKIQAAIAAGVKLLGENYVQEAVPKIEAVGPSVEWHMIGHLQKNKVKTAVRLFAVIESLDSIELADLLDREGEKQGKVIRAYLEVNLAGEESKSGLSEENLEPLLRRVEQLSHLQLEGLMVIPPLRESPEDVRPFFQRLKALQGKINAMGIPNVDLKELSMGMTHDYPVAIQEGATIVRIGTALFGERRK